MLRIHSDRKCLSGVLACVMAYVVVLQVTLALTLNASLAAGLSLTFGEICLSSPAADSSADIPQPLLNRAAHCPLCVAPAFALLPPPDSAAVVVRRALDIAFEVAEGEQIRVAEVTSAHRARAPPGGA